MKTIEERADEYIGHPLDIDEPLNITSIRNGFLAGAKSEHEELTRWHNPNEEIPDEYKQVMIKYTRNVGCIYYAVAYRCRVYDFDYERITWKVTDADYFIKPNDVVSWREIHE